jgi:uncharacterized protein YdeI (YjbR/CyaY-like superfamily)
LGVDDGDVIKVELKKDDSKYGLPMPEELLEVMRQDLAADKLFHGLTPGNQRLAIRLVDMSNDVDKRIHRSLMIIEYLKHTEGKFVYNEIAIALKHQPPTVD